MLQRLCLVLLHVWLPMQRPQARSHCCRENQLRKMLRLQVKQSQVVKQTAAVMALARLQASVFVKAAGLEAFVTCQCVQATAMTEVFACKGNAFVRVAGMALPAI